MRLSGTASIPWSGSDIETFLLSSRQLPRANACIKLENTPTLSMPGSRLRHDTSDYLAKIKSREVASTEVQSVLSEDDYQELLNVIRPCALWEGLINSSLLFIHGAEYLLVIRVRPHDAAIFTAPIRMRRPRLLSYIAALFRQKCLLLGN